jgi:signal transduction histidine kinase
LKLWQKIFLLTLTLVIIVVNATSLALLANNHRLAIEREQQSALTRHNYLIAEIHNTIIYEQLVKRTTLTDEEALDVTMGVLRRQSGSTDMDISLFKDREVVKSADQPPFDVELPLLSQPDNSSSIIEWGGKTYLLIVSMTTLNVSTLNTNGQPYQLISSYDISSTYDLFKQDFDQVRAIGIISALIVAGLLLLLARGLLHPLRNLSNTTHKIASGDLDNRVTVRGHDELAEVARSLNTMADSIEHNVTALEQLAESRRVFIGNLAHEMKTPLTSILGFSDILRVKRDVSESERIEYADVIVSETKRLQALSGKLMELLTLGNTQITPERTEIHELVTELETTLQPILKNSAIKLVSELPTDDAIINVDRELIKSLIFNLIDNSIKASSPPSTIRLVVAADDTAVEFTVTDEGVGIPADQIPLLTEPFYMLDKARTRKHGGAGLGLALCSEIAQAHGSILKITSEPDVGTSVSFALAKGADND